MSDHKISVVIICKNESSCIGECLKSVEGADEIIVCDTGSTDDTVEIAKKHTDKIFHFPWIDDFSAARNHAKQFASNDWILSIDCDEVMEEGGMKMLNEFASDAVKGIDGAYVTMWNGVESRCDSIRLFRKSLDWKGRIHEAVSPLLPAAIRVTIQYGRSDAHDMDPDIDLRIMKSVAEEDPLNTRNLFYLAREYSYYGQYHNAIDTYERYLSLNSPHFTEVTDAWYMLALCYWHDGRGNGEKSRECLMKAILRNCNMKAAHRLMSEQMIDPLKRKTWLAFEKIADDSNCLFIR